MDVLDQAQLLLLKTMLEQRRAALALQERQGTAVGELAVDEVETSPADKATVRLLNDLANEAADHNTLELSAVRHALAKFGDASYGLCEVCGNDIGFSRLQARPEARLCIACQTRAEKR
ncbi:MAG: TraR/DksA C4-type zinc finger protein [Pseudomonadota bacterium]